MRLRLLCVTLLAWIVSPTVALGQDTTPLNLPESATSPEQVSSGAGAGNLLRAVLMLAVVCGLIWLVAKVLKRAGGEDGGPGAGAHPAIRVLARNPVGRGQQVLTIQAGEQVVVLLQTAQGTNMLRSLSSQAARDEGLSQAVPADPPAAKLSDMVAAGRDIIDRLRQVKQGPVRRTETVKDIINKGGMR